MKTFNSFDIFERYAMFHPLFIATTYIVTNTLVHTIIGWYFPCIVVELYDVFVDKKLFHAIPP